MTNERRDYRGVAGWHPATYVGTDPKMAGLVGEAQHRVGDYWCFRYWTQGRTPRIGFVEAFRTEIMLEPRA